MIRFRFAPRKALEAIQWMLSRKDSLDLHTVLKACYFADKAHLNKHFQPIFGATYQAMAYGPVPLEIYELLKGESLRLSELKIEFVPWDLVGYHVKRNNYTNIGNIQLESFSETEVDELEAGLKESCSMSFNRRTAATHGPDWHRANGGIMKYEDMLYERDDKSSIVRNLKETSRFIRL